MARSSYAKGAVLIFALFVLVIEGYFGYRWYQRYYGKPAETVLSSAPGVDNVAEPESEGDRGDALVHRATPENIVDNSTYVNHPASNGNPNAVLLVTQAWNTDGTPANAHPTGVWYDENRGGRWAIFNQDIAPMPEGAVFNVVILKEPGEATFVHRVSPANTNGEITYIDQPSANADNDAILLVTPSWNPGGGTGTYNDHPVGVWYDEAEKKWAIRNQDLAPLPLRAAFDVSVRGNRAQASR